ncbi:MAG: aldose 1-epimerase family protein [Verrucomicrobiia bacterium]
MNPTEPFRQVLTSVERNIDLADWSIDSRALRLEGRKFEIRKRRLHGGRQEGVDLITIDNGRLAVTVIPTRGMGILKVESPALRLGWNSPVRQVVHPQFVNLQSRGGLGWLEGFNEWLVRCGLESAGAPGKDQFITNTGDQAEMDLTLHGKIANIPASEVEVVIERVPPFAIRLRGKVDEAMFYGPKLELWTELVIEPGAMRFQVQDTVTNRGGADQEFELIYHINFGEPLVQAGAAFAGAAKRVTPINAHAAKDVAQHASYSGPIPGFVEQVYCMEPLADAQGRTTVLLRNAAGDRAASLAYAVHQLPCFTLWKSTNVAEEGYVTGLEPGTSFPNNRRVEREAGRVPKLTPGESRRFVIDVALHTTREEVAGASQQVERLRVSAAGSGS